MIEYSHVKGKHLGDRCLPFVFVHVLRVNCFYSNLKDNSQLLSIRMHPSEEIADTKIGHQYGKESDGHIDVVVA